MKVVTASPGRRDGYQVPIALASVDLLQTHVTDYYLPDYIFPLLESLDSPLLSNSFGSLLRRHHPSLPSSLVHCSRRLALAKVVERFIPYYYHYWKGDQDPISWSSLAIARKYNSALLLHMGYANHAFHHNLAKELPKGLIQYHPHIRECSRILFDDLKRYPQLSNAKDQLISDLEDTSNQSELESADMIVCNSTFTALTCTKLGIDSRKLNVIPFGIDISPSPSFTRPTPGVCRFLFVGSGIHRKGLHHLLEAWRLANLQFSELTIVCRYIDPQIKQNFPIPDRVHLLQSVNETMLAELYCQSDVFVLPSLVEGFGYVYLEAMSKGCYCVGTHNTGLPDIATPQTASIIPAANPSLLASSLLELQDYALTVGFDRNAISSSLVNLNWASFRNQIATSVSNKLLHL